MCKPNHFTSFRIFFNGASSSSEQCYGLSLKLSPPSLCPALPCPDWWHNFWIHLGTSVKVLQLENALDQNQYLHA